MSNLDKKFDKLIHDLKLKADRMDNHDDAIELILGFNIKADRMDRVDKYLINVDFDKLLKRLISEHTDEYVQKWNNKFIEPKLTNKMELLFDWIFWRDDIVGKDGEICNEVQAVDEITKDFSADATYFRGYTFEIIQGQGCIYRIYDKDKNIIFNW